MSGRPVQGKGNRDRVNIDEMLADLDIARCKNQYPSEMSGGEKQRVAIARAFVNDPDIILADRVYHLESGTLTE